MLTNWGTGSAASVGTGEGLGGAVGASNVAVGGTLVGTAVGTGEGEGGTGVSLATGCDIATVAGSAGAVGGAGVAVGSVAQATISPAQSRAATSSRFITAPFLRSFQSSGVTPAG